MTASVGPEQCSPAAALRRRLLWLLLAILLLRLSTLVVPDLLDNTEGRYGAIGLRMLSSGDWLMPQVPTDLGYEPYFGKPPLHFWLLAASMRLFGANAFAARLPSLLMAVVMVAAVIAFARRRFGDVLGFGSGFVLASMAMFFVLAGSVNVDMTLAAAVTVAVLASCRVAEAGSSRWWGHLYFLSLAVGCLDKGPIAIALAGLAGIAHLAVYRDRRVVTRLPWITGPLLFLAITVPWFWLAERQHPGFLRYFFVNENLDRFVASDYGDRYGSGRKRAPGSIWLWLLACALPWSLVPITAVLRRSWRARARSALGRDGAFMLLWGISPAVMFTLSPQFTPDYVLPGFGGLAIAMALWIGRGGAALPLQPDQLGRAGLCLGVASALVGCIGLGAGLLPGSAALVLAAASAVFLWPRLRAPRTSPYAIGLAALALAAAFSALIVASAPFASRRKSTAPILRTGSSLQAWPTRLGISAHNAFSARFYAEALSAGVTSIERVFADQLDDDSPDDLLMRRSDLRLVPPSMRQRYHTVAQVDKWMWLEREPAQPR